VRQLLVTANVFPSSEILATLMMEALSSFETTVLTRATRGNIRENAILHSHRRENLKSYTHYTLPPKAAYTFSKAAILFFIKPIPSERSIFVKEPITA
jgi:hypothetical protein